MLDILTYFGVITIYYIAAASTALLIKKLLSPSSELFRKMLHVIVVMFAFVLIDIFPTWHMAVIVVLAFVAVVYPILTLIEHLPQYGKVLAERKDGEVKMSLILVFTMFAILTALFWGYTGPSWKYIIIVAVMAWGYGDAAAALIGKAYGRHKIEHPLIDGKKTVEGTLAMFAVSCLAIFITTAFYSGMPLHICAITALIVAPVCAVVELFSRHGIDTITVPIFAAISTFSVISLFIFLGV